MAQADRHIVIFDLGGVLIDWDPRHLYRKLFAGDEAAMEHFLATVCTHEWNRGNPAQTKSHRPNFAVDHRSRPFAEI
jgi:FMN phosphatase YigB (HAD superfamily)